MSVHPGTPSSGSELMETEELDSSSTQRLHLSSSEDLTMKIKFQDSSTLVVHYWLRRFSNVKLFLNHPDASI